LGIRPGRSRLRLLSKLAPAFALAPAAGWLNLGTVLADSGDLHFGD